MDLRILAKFGEIARQGRWVTGDIDQRAWREVNNCAADGVGQPGGRRIGDQGQGNRLFPEGNKSLLATCISSESASPAR